MKLVPLKVFYADKKPLIRRHIFSPVDWIQIKVSSFILKCHSKENDSRITSGSQERPHQRWFQSWKVFLIIKKQLAHWQLLGNSIRITLASQGVLVGIYKEQDMQGYFSMPEMWMNAIRCILWWNRSTFRRSQCLYALSQGHSAMHAPLCFLDKPSVMVMKKGKMICLLFCEWGGCRIQLVTFLHGIRKDLKADCWAEEYIFSVLI